MSSWPDVWILFSISCVKTMQWKFNVIQTAMSSTIAFHGLSYALERGPVQHNIFGQFHVLLFFSLYSLSFTVYLRPSAIL